MFNDIIVHEWFLTADDLFHFLVPKTYFQNREFSFTLKDDIYIRYQSFADQSEMEKEIQKRCPYKIDIGAVFTHRVSKQHQWHLGI